MIKNPNSRLQPSPLKPTKIITYCEDSRLKEPLIIRLTSAAQIKHTLTNRFRHAITFLIPQNILTYVKKELRATGGHLGFNDLAFLILYSEGIDSTVTYYFDGSSIAEATVYDPSELVDVAKRLLSHSPILAKQLEDRECPLKGLSHGFKSLRDMENQKTPSDNSTHSLKVNLNEKMFEIKYNPESEPHSGSRCTTPNFNPLNSENVSAFKGSLNSFSSLCKEFSTEASSMDLLTIPKKSDPKKGVHQKREKCLNRSQGKSLFKSHNSNFLCNLLDTVPLPLDRRTKEGDILENLETRESIIRE